MATRSRWAGYAGMAWALAYVPIHVYWALGGSAAFLGLARSTADFRVANWGASVVLVGAALVALALVRPWGRVVPRWALLGLAWVGAAAAILHWGAYSAVAVLRRIGAIPLPDGVPAARIASVDWWNLAVFEPWFLGMGIFLAIAATQHVRLSPGGEPAGGRLGRAAAAILLLGGLVVVLYGVMTFDAWVFLLYGPVVMATGVAIAMLTYNRKTIV